jgi:calcineurin-like phosphoesterase family protein
MDTNMSKIFVVSDTHNVFKGADGPPMDPIFSVYASTWRAGVGGKEVPDPVKEAQRERNKKEYLMYLGTYYKNYIQAWNALIRPTDRVIHLGDVIWDMKKLRVFSLLNGVKHLVLGNHDSMIYSTQYRDYFTNVQHFNAFENIIFSHKPICPDHPKFNSCNVGKHTTTMNLSQYAINIHGHFHYSGLTKEFVRDTDRTDVVATDSSIQFYDTSTHLIHYCVDELPVDLNTIRAQIATRKSYAA